MNQILTISKKELLEILRDKECLILLIMPTLLVLFLSGIIGYSFQDNAIDDFHISMNAKAAYVEKNIHSPEDDLLSSFFNSQNINVTRIDNDTSIKYLEEGAVDLVIINESKYNYQFIYNSLSLKSSFLTMMIYDSFQDYSQHYNYDNNLLCVNGKLINSKGTSSNKNHLLRSIIIYLLPFFVIMLIPEFPAIFSNDLFAGEREKHTLESLLLSGVSKTALYFGKTLCLVILTLIENCTIFIVILFSTIIPHKNLIQEYMIGSTVCIIFAFIYYLLLVLLICFNMSMFSLFSKTRRTSQMLTGIFSFIPAGITIFAMINTTTKINYILALIPMANNIFGLLYSFNGMVSFLYLFITAIINILTLAIISQLCRLLLNSERILY